MKKILQKVILVSALLWPIQQGTAQETLLQNTKQQTVEVLTDNHETIINESIVSILKKYGIEKWMEIISKHLLIEINKERAKIHLKPVALNSNLQAAAQEHAQFLNEHHDWYFNEKEEILHDPHAQYDMVTKQKTTNVWDRTKKAWYQNYESTSENIAHNTKTIKETVMERMNSRGHRETILKEDFTEMGVGITFGKKMRVITFGTPNN